MGIRFVAAMLDSIILGMMLLPLSFGIQLLKLEQGSPASIALTILTYIVSFSITAWFFTKKGGLPGKMILGLKVVDLRTGHFLSPWKAVLRESIGKILSTLLLFGGYLMVAFRMDKRGLHDLISNSQVLRKR